MSGQTWRGELLNNVKTALTIRCGNHHAGSGRTQRITHFIGVEEDITERKADEEKLHFLAYYEPLMWRCLTFSLE